MGNEQKRTQERKTVSTFLVFSCLYFELELNKCIQNTKNISKTFNMASEPGNITNKNALN